ncbi:MAG: hypothetical protein KF900_05190 [Bacteroidetes bacterium]|nr:hypothetical protein [Bacteroidota bacterium]
MKNILLVILFSFFVVAISSCDPKPTYMYKVINKSNQKIRIEFSRDYNTTSLISNEIEPNSEKTMGYSGKGVFVSNYQTDSHLKGHIGYIEIYQDSIKSKTDFSLSSKWEYKENGKRSATYSCEVYQSDF